MTSTRLSRLHRLWFISVFARFLGCASTVSPDAGADVTIDRLAVDTNPEANSNVIHTCGAGTMMGSFDWASYSAAESTCAAHQPCRLCIQTMDFITGHAVGWEFFADSNCACPMLIPDAGSARCTDSTTFAIPTRAEADALCAGQTDCLVCVEREGATGPTLWLAMRNAPGCACP